MGDTMNDIYITLIGNVSAEPRQYSFNDGLRVTSLRLASTRRVFDKSSQSWHDGETTFYAVRCYRALAENVAQSIKLGQPIVVHGKLRIRSYEREGERRFLAEVEAIAVGHDLRRGLSRFERAQRGLPASAADEDARRRLDMSTQDWEMAGQPADPLAPSAAALPAPPSTYPSLSTFPPSEPTGFPGLPPADPTNLSSGLSPAQPTAPSGGLSFAHATAPSGSARTLADPAAPSHGGFSPADPAAPSHGGFSPADPAAPSGGGFSPVDPTGPSSSDLSPVDPTVPSGGGLSSPESTVPSGDGFSPAESTGPSGSGLPPTSLIGASALSSADSTAMLDPSLADLPSPSSRTSGDVTPLSPRRPEHASSPPSDTAEHSPGLLPDGREDATVLSVDGAGEVGDLPIRKESRTVTDLPSRRSGRAKTMFVDKDGGGLLAERRGDGAVGANSEPQEQASEESQTRAKAKGKTKTGATTTAKPGARAKTGAKTDAKPETAERVAA
ncbi:single-stranded DNA-binding protein [Sphaerisporangium corydalis]|uniref:Single-stranded DNA-binding protein n=1 Tax=Sphaerisporangium corydalis TaxID=1441875 RepID=A0ABV9EN77_9ACTN|nr:single-stranded DNA-binding protein [Sphaerisporangium corydalis]